MGFYFVCQLEWHFTFMQSLFFLWWNYMCLGIEPLFDLSIFISVDKVKGRILYNKVWKDNRTHWDTCQYWWKRQLNTCKSLNGYINRLNPIHKHTFDLICLCTSAFNRHQKTVITKGKVKTQKYINRQNQSTTGKP